MHYLLINQFFPPDPAPTGQLLADVARSLSAQGHSVEVICAQGGYASAKTKSSEIADVTVRRLRSLSFGRGPAARLLSYASFYTRALGGALFARRPDVVLTLTTPPLLSVAGTAVKFLRGAEHLIWEMDLYPDIAVALSVIKPGSLLDRAIGGVVDWSRRHSGGVIALGPCMRARLLARGIPAEKVHVAENWADGALITPRPFPSAGPLTVLYSGNLGLAHDVDTIAGAMGRLSDPTRFRFVFAGGGAGHLALRAHCEAEALGNTVFLPYQDQDRLAEHLGTCHVGFVSQKAEACGSVVPSKTYALMAAGRPFVYVGPSSATPALIARRFRCGWQVEPGDVSSLVNLLDLLAAQPQMVHTAGSCAHQAFLQFYDLPKGVSNITGILTAGATAIAAASPALPASD